MNKAIKQTIEESVFRDNPSARKILYKKLESMMKYPSSTKAQELEEMGMSVDYQEGDEGNDPKLK